MRTYNARDDQAKGGGYVYVIAFSDGTVKVGRSADAVRRLKDHKATARSFGLEIASEWISPRHRDWKENELELIRLARELGGTQNNGEYFAGVSFGALAEEAARLAFVPAGPEAPRQPGRRNAMPAWLRSEVDALVKWAIPCGDRTADVAVAELTDRALRCDPDLVRLLVERHMHKTLLAAFKGEVGEQPAVKTPEPEPPQPNPPAGAAPRTRGHLRAIAGGASEITARAA